MYGVIDSKRLENIASAIRDKTGTDTTYAPSEMPIGIEEVYEKGQEKERSDFWDIFQQNGARTNYIYGFGGYGWNDTTFKPKYNIVPTGSASGLFYDVRIKNLEDLLLKAGVTLDTSNCTGMVNAFRDSSVTVVPTINTAKFDSGNLQNTFRNCLSLVTIRKLILQTDGKQIYTSTFDECSNLQNIVVEGVIGRTVTFRWSPLSVGSLKSIISCLKDYTGGSEHSYTVTFKASAFAVLEAEGATAEYNGVPCTWAELIDNKKWNLTLA